MVEFLAQWGYAGLFLGAFLSATVVPFSSDVLMVGLLLSGGDPLLSFLSATAGNWLGGMTSFFLGWLGRWEWLEKWFRVRRSTLERQQSRVERFGPLLALLTWVPFVGDVFAIALGFYRLNLWKCSIYMLVGKAARFAVYAAFFAGR